MIYEDMAGVSKLDGARVVRRGGVHDVTTIACRSQEFKEEGQNIIYVFSLITESKNTKMLSTLV